eukprot:GSChrysophyteH1.ASY1.ANO1.1266.1 assembled CDS
MYDIMEQRVTTVEQLSKSRAPFPEMEVLYFCSPSTDSIQKIVADFPNGQPGKYGDVHLYFTDTISDSQMEMMQNAPNLLNKVKTLKEINLDFIAAESGAFHLDMKDCLGALYGSSPDAKLPKEIARKLATACITMNEHPCIRYQESSPLAKQIAVELNDHLKAYRRANPKGSFNGDDAQGERERAQLLLVDRSLDPLSPFMHEYTYQAMAYDLLNVEGDNVISYMSTNNNGQTEEKKALLGENDELWTEFRHEHIYKVIEKIKTRMTDILQNNSGAALAAGRGKDLKISDMAAAVKQLPEFKQTMSKLSQHTALAQQCMDSFGKLQLMDLSQCEQTVSTGQDEDGTTVKGSALHAKTLEMLRTIKSKALKKRLIGIYIASQRNATQQEIHQLMDAAGLGPNEQKFIQNVNSLSSHAKVAAVAETTKSGGMFSTIFGGRRQSVKMPSTAEGEYVDTRHVGVLKGCLEQLINGDLPVDKYPAMGPSISSSSEAKANAKSMRRYGSNNRWGKRETNVTGSRVICFVVGGIAYSEMRAGYELQAQHSKEVVVGSTHFVSPDEYMGEVHGL